MVFWINMIFKKKFSRIFKASYSNIILNVAEKNDSAKNIARLLSKGQLITKEGNSKYNKVYTFDFTINNVLNKMIMTSVSGHLLSYGFPSKLSNWNSTDPTLLFDTPVKKMCMRNNIHIKKTLQNLIKFCQMLVIWTDCDREGENIGMEIVEVCLAVNPNIVVKRAKFSEITAQSVIRAVQNLVDMDIKLSQAVDVRQQLDLKSGAAFTRLQTLFLQPRFPKIISNQIISYGSCQFPTLGFVVERFKEVENFVSEPFWKMILTHEKDGKLAKFYWENGRTFEENVISSTFANITEGGSVAHVIDVINKRILKWRPVALDTIEMMKLSSRKLKIDPKTTMQIAENLYSQGYISYPRTETNIFPKETNLSSLVEAQVSDNRWGEFTSKLLLDALEPHNGKKSDKAHPPIYPLKSGYGLVNEEAQLFELITRHFLACLSKNAVAFETQVLIECVSKSHWSNDSVKKASKDSSNVERFKISGQSILERNFLDIYPYVSWANKEIPLYHKGDIFDPNELKIEKEHTSPPNLLSDADLITLMDKHGIGTDSTHAEHIEKIKTRQYVKETNGRSSYLKPGQVGLGLVKAYDTIGLNLLFNPNLRAKFEADLKLICQGEKQADEVLNYHLKEYKELFRETSSRMEKFISGFKSGIYDLLPEKSSNSVQNENEKDTRSDSVSVKSN